MLTKIKKEDYYIKSIVIALFSILAISLVLGTQRVEAAPGDLVITSVSEYQVIQRDDNNQADISITGTMSATPCSAVEASFNGGAFQTIDSSPSASDFSGTLLGQSAGQGALEVRCTDNLTATGSISIFGIGDVFVVAGQSNARVAGYNSNSYSHPSLIAGQIDAYGSVTTDWDEGNNYPGPYLGNPYPIIATRVMAQENVPFAWIQVALGGTRLVSPPALWDKAGDATAYNQAITTITDEAPNGFKAMLWFQGESDAIADVDQASYAAGFDTLVSNFKSDIPGDYPIISGSIGQLSLTNNYNPDPIRLALQEAWDSNPDVFSGPVMHDVGPLDSDPYTVHYVSDEEVQTLTDRWWASISTHIYGSGSDARGPLINSAIYDSSRAEVMLNFDDESLPLKSPEELIQGIVIRENNADVSGTEARILDEDSILVTLPQQLSGDLTVSYGVNGTADTDSFFTDSSTYSLPAETVIDYPVAEGSIGSLVDVDGDGINDDDESAAPGGDGNADGIEDRLQAEVATVPNSVNDGYTTIETAGCNTVTGLSVKEQSAFGLDSGFTYPAGLNDFTLECGSVGDTATVTIYFDRQFSEQDTLVRKFINNEFIDISSKATYGTASIGSNAVTTISFSITDGGALDSDGAANGLIVDPIGIAQAEELLSETGNEATSSVLIGLFILFMITSISIRSTVVSVRR